MPPDWSISGGLYSSSDVYTWAIMLMNVMKPRRYYFTDVYVNFCSYIDYRYALADEPCNLVKCDNHTFMFNKVFKVALDAVLTKRIKDGAEPYILLTGMPPRVHYGNVQPSSLLVGLREWR